jgi:2-amino-4-hydroxy-6-hydroxymethyldihydropteridine diphosphokinase
MTTTAFIALGSNLGDRRALLEQALIALRSRSDIEVVRVSSLHETEPVGGPPGQGPYLNAAAELRTPLPPDQLLHVLLKTERDLGRVRTEPNAPRTIDLDLLLYGSVVCSTPELTLPHPRMHERLFVLGPLAEIDPESRHPLIGRTVGAMLADVTRGRSVSSVEPTQSGRGELAGMRAVVTGSTSGIGRAIALALATAGADVIIHGRRSLTASLSVAAETETHGVRTQVILADLRQPVDCERLVRRAWETWTGIDVWVNNAGADTLTGEAAHWSFERKLEELLAVDVMATMRLSRAVGQRMKQRGRGVILNVGWDQAETGMEGDSGELFAATKGAVMAFSKSLALSLAPEVRVNCLAPGWIKTAWGERASEAWQQRAVRETPLRRWGTAEDVAAVACWLASPAAAFLTGQVIRINGGTIR